MSSFEAYPGALDKLKRMAAAERAETRRKDMTSSNLIQTRHHTATWMDRPGTSWMIARTRNAAERRGERVAVVRWADTGELELRHCKGDGRRADFVVFDQQTIPNGTDQDAVDYATQRII